MKKFYSTFFLTLMTITSFVYGQKMKIGNDICAVQKVKLPTNYTEPKQRTYDVETKGLYATGIDPHEKKIYGWELDSANPNVRAVISIYGFTIDSPSRKSEKKEKKDKDGKVIDTWTEYYYMSEATGKATLYVYGIEHPFEFDKKSNKISKYEEKQEAKAEAEKKDLEDNPFLNQEVIEEAEDAESDMGTDEGLEDSELPLVKTIRIDRSKQVKTKNHRSTSAAYKDYRENHRPNLTAYRQDYPSEAYRSAIRSLNSLYGYGPTVYKFYLKKVKSDKHPEAKMWNDACQATETIFKTFKYNSSIAESQVQFEPIVKYFADQVDNIPADDKKNRKQKKAALQNLLNILYYLDQHDDVIEWSSKFLDDKKLDKTAEKMLEKSERQKAHLAFLNMENGHIESEEVIEDEDIEEEVEEDDELADEDSDQ